jgi:putative ABC transport system substrate-binding protein
MATSAPSLNIQLSQIGVRSAAEIENAVTLFAKEPNGALVVMADQVTNFHRDLIIDLAARHRLPAIYQSRYFAAAGGLISYGSYLIDQFQRAASYVDSILKGKSPADLPIQQPTKFELVINLKSAKALDLDVPLRLQQLADEVIE